MNAEAIRRELVEGNRRYVAGKGRAPRAADRRALLAGQRPRAVVLGCSDSRVPPEIVFDQAEGALFVVRVAGHVATPAVRQSVEFAVGEFDVPLVLVLGHGRCGAVTAALTATPDVGYSAILPVIRPALPAVARGHPDEETIRRAVRAHVLATVARLRRESLLLSTRVREGRLLLEGAVCSLETGEVEFLDPGGG